MKKTRFFKKSLPRKRQKKARIRKIVNKRNSPNNLYPITNEKTHDQRTPNSNQCFTSNPNTPNDFNLNEEEDIIKNFSCFEVIDNKIENNFINFNGDDPSNIPGLINIDVNDSLFEKEKIL